MRGERLRSVSQAPGARRLSQHAGSACVYDAQGCTRLRSLTLRHAGEEARRLAAAPTQLVALLTDRCKLLTCLTLDGCELSPRAFEVGTADQFSLP